MTEQNDNSRTPGQSWLDDRLIRLDAVYRRFGRDGLKDYSLQDVSLLLSAKELEFRDAPKGRDLSEKQKMENRRLELEIKDLTCHLNSHLAGTSLHQGRNSFSGGKRIIDNTLERGKFQQRSPDRNRERDRD